MKQALYRWQIAGFVFVSVAGTLLHFAYEWSGNSPLFAVFSAVNESIAEHNKLLFFPLLLFWGIEHRSIGKQYPAFWCHQLASTVIGLCLIPTLYYTYTGALGVSADWFNIAIFFIATAVVFFTGTRRLIRDRTCRISPPIALILLLVLALLLVIFTFAPPPIPLFQDPQTQAYGLPQPH